MLSLEANFVLYPYCISSNTKLVYELPPQLFKTAFSLSTTIRFVHKFARWVLKRILVCIRMVIISWRPNLFKLPPQLFKTVFAFSPTIRFFCKNCLMSLEENFGLFLDGNYLNTKFAFKLTRGMAVFRSVAKANCRWYPDANEELQYRSKRPPCIRPEAFSIKL